MIFDCTVIMFFALSNCYCFKLKEKFPFHFCVLVAFNSITLWTHSRLINVGIPPVEIAPDNVLKRHKCHICFSVAQKNALL